MSGSLGIAMKRKEKSIPHWSRGRIAGWAILPLLLWSSKQEILWISSFLSSHETKKTQETPTPRWVEGIYTVFFCCTFLPFMVVVFTMTKIMVLDYILQRIVLALDGVSCQVHDWSEPKSVHNHNPAGPSYYRCAAKYYYHRPQDEEGQPVEKSIWYESRKKPIRGETTIGVQVHPHEPDLLHRFTEGRSFPIWSGLCCWLLCDLGIASVQMRGIGERICLSLAATVAKDGGGVCFTATLDTWGMMGGSQVETVCTISILGHLMATAVVL